MSERTHSQSALEAKLVRLERRMEEALAHSKQRQFLTTLAVAAILLGAVGYLWWLSSTIAAFADANTVVELASAQIQPHLDAEAARFSETLEAQAPAVIDQVEKVLVAAPPQIAREAENYTVSMLKGQLASLEKQTYEVASSTLTNTLVKAHDEGIDLTDDKQLDALVDSVAPTMKAELGKAVEKLHAEYANGAADVAAVIEELTADGGEKLDATKRAHRELLLTGLALIKKMEADPKRAPLQNILEGRSLPSLDPPAQPAR
jgi:hypothetical protein